MNSPSQDYEARCLAAHERYEAELLVRVFKEYLAGVAEWVKLETTKE